MYAVMLTLDVRYTTLIPYPSNTILSDIGTFVVIQCKHLIFLN